MAVRIEKQVKMIEDLFNDKKDLSSKIEEMFNSMQE